MSNENKIKGDLKEIECNCYNLPIQTKEFNRVFITQVRAHTADP